MATSIPSNTPSNTPSSTRSRRKRTGPAIGSAKSFWHKSAPPVVRKAFESGDSNRGWNAWVEHLARRKWPAPLTEMLSIDESPLLWALPEALENCDTPERLVRIVQLSIKDRGGSSSPQHMLSGWLADAAGSAADEGCALEALAWCHSMPRLAGMVSADAWWDMLDHLVSLVNESGQIKLDDDPLLQQLLAGELALALACLFPEIASTRKLSRSARRALSTGLVDLLDGEGVIRAGHIGLLHPLLACWTRCRILENGLKKGCLHAAARDQYEWLVRHALRLTRYDGTQVFGDGSAGRRADALLSAALRFDSDKDDHAIATLVRARKKKKAAAAKTSPKTLPDVALHSPWAATSVLCPAWSPSAPRLTVLHSGRSIRMELDCKRDVVWMGEWGLELRCDGEPAMPASDWEEVCWISDEDVDYLELEIEMTGGLRVQRQMLLAREDGFLMLADVVLGRRPGKLEYRGCLPLAGGIAFEGADETWEGFLVGGKRRALVLPLALPEWRCDRPSGTLVVGQDRNVALGARGSLAATDGFRGRQAAPGTRQTKVDGPLAQVEQRLELCQVAEGRALYAPLFLDLNSRRMTRPATWRQLTVAESRQSQPNDVAVGYRVMLGKEQWLIYRSLAERANRTLLGHNLSTEMLVARFHRTGEVEPLVEIE